MLTKILMEELGKKGREIEVDIEELLTEIRGYVLEQF